MTIDKKEKKNLEIGYINSEGSEVYYADKAARQKLKKIEGALLNIQDSVETVSLLKDSVKKLESKVNSITSTDAVPKNLNTLTNEVTADQINMFTKSIYLYVDNHTDNLSKPGKVNIIELGKIHNKLTPLVKTIDDKTQLSTIDEGEYIYLSENLTNK